MKSSSKILSLQPVEIIYNNHKFFNSWQIMFGTSNLINCFECLLCDDIIHNYDYKSSLVLFNRNITITYKMLNIIINFI